VPLFVLQIAQSSNSDTHPLAKSRTNWSSFDQRSLDVNIKFTKSRASTPYCALRAHPGVLTVLQTARRRAAGGNDDGARAHPAQSMPQCSQTPDPPWVSSHVKRRISKHIQGTSRGLSLEWRSSLGRHRNPLSATMWWRKRER